MSPATVLRSKPRFTIASNYLHVGVATSLLVLAVVVARLAAEGSMGLLPLLVVWPIVDAVVLLSGGAAYVPVALVKVAMIAACVLGFRARLLSGRLWVVAGVMVWCVSGYAVIAVTQFVGTVAGLGGR